MPSCKDKKVESKSLVRGIGCIPGARGKGASGKGFQERVYCFPVLRGRMSDVRVTVDVELRPLALSTSTAIKHIYRMHVRAKQARCNAI